MVLAWGTTLTPCLRDRESDVLCLNQISFIKSVNVLLQQRWDWLTSSGYTLSAHGLVWHTLLLAPCRSPPPDVHLGMQLQHPSDEYLAYSKQQTLAKCTTVTMSANSSYPYLFGGFLTLPPFLGASLTGGTSTGVSSRLYSQELLNKKLSLPHFSLICWRQHPNKFSFSPFLLIKQAVAQGIVCISHK